MAESPTPTPTPTPTPVAFPEATVTPAVEASPQPRPRPTPAAEIRPLPLTPREKKRLTISTLPLFRLSGNDRISAEERVSLIKRRVDRLMELHGSNPPPVVVDRIMGSTVVRAGEYILVTVTPSDIPDFNVEKQTQDDRYRMESEVAQVWRSALQQEINLAATMRTPDYLRFALSMVVVLFVFSAAGHRGLTWLGRRHLKSPLWSAKILLWSLSTYLGLRLFPQTRNWAELVYTGVLYPYLLLLLVFVGGLGASFLAERMVRRYFLALQQSQEGVHLSRLGLRLATLDQAARVTVRAVLVIVFMILYLVWLKIDLGAVVAGAGVVGVTLGLAAQDLIKNFLAGVTILLEDHFGIGDVIECNGVTGTVEAFHLRCTQIRTVDGRLATIPNSAMSMVQNHSNGWGRVDFRVEVAYKENLERALSVLREVAEQLADDWEEQITEPPAVMGVEALGDNGVTLRVLLRTIPLSQWSVKRELNRRVKDRFDQEGIEIPFPQRTIWTKSLDQASASQREEDREDHGIAPRR